MSWDLINIMATWAAALGAMTCALSITRLIRFQRQTNRETMASLKEMADTYRAGWKMMNDDIEQLNARVAALEER